MKQITLTIREFYLFKEVAHFFYDFSVSTNNVIVEAKAHELELLGY